MYYIYRCKNIIDGKSYVGQTTSFKERKKRHFEWANSSSVNKQYFHEKLKEIGFDNFSWDILAKVSSKSRANELEGFYIAKHNCIRPNGYNVLSGGCGKKGTAVLQYSAEGSFIQEFESVTIASDLTGATRTAIMGCLQGVYKKANGFIWIAKGDEQSLSEKVKNAPIKKVVINQIDDNGNIVATYPNCREAARRLGLDEKCYKTIWATLKKTTKAYDFYWEKA